MAAITADEVDVVMDADISSYLRNLGLADKTFSNMVTSATEHAKLMGVAFTQIGDRAKTALTPIPALAGNVNRSLGAVRANTANIAAQFQDIAVQLAAGQSPFLIALQQGTQLSAALGPNQGLGGVVKSLGAGLLSVISPVSLLTIGVIALGGAAIQWLSHTGTDLAAVNAEIKAQRDFISNLPSVYEAAKNAATAYRNAAAPPKEEILHDTAADRAKALKDEQEQLRQLIRLSSSVDFTPRNIATPAITAEERKQNDELERSARALAAIGDMAKGADPNLNQLVQSLNDFIATNPSGTLRRIAEDMLTNAKNAREFAINAGEAKAVIESFPKDIEVQIRLALRQEQFETAFAKLKDLQQGPSFDNSFDAARAAAKATADEASRSATTYGELVGLSSRYKIVLDSITAAEKQDNDRKAAQGKLSEAKAAAETITHQQQAVVDLIDALQFQREELGKTDEQQAVDNNLRKAGAAATGDQRALIEEVTKSIYEQADAHKKNAAELQQFLDLGKTGLQAFFSSLQQGNSILAALGDALGSIGQQLLNSGINDLFSGGGPIASLLSGGTSTGGVSLPGIGMLGHPRRAGGGPVNRGQPYIVGEGGVPEVFTPSSPGSITPMSKLGSTVNAVFAPNLSMPGADSNAVARMESTLRQLMSEFTPRVRAEVKGYRNKWA